MKNVNRVFIYGNDTDSTAAVMPHLEKSLSAAGIGVSQILDETVDMVIVIGGDGTFLRLLRDFSFPDVPVAGINTGHLGFFMEYSPAELDSFVLDIKSGNYCIHRHLPLKAEIVPSDGEPLVCKGINDVVIKKNASSIVHLNMSIGSSFIEKFSGDGLLISTPAGSTSYNYSVDGGIIDPRVSVLQVTPIAPMNTTSYRSFTSGVILPGDMSVCIGPEHPGTSGLVIVDGAEYWIDRLECVNVCLVPEDVLLVRKPDYDYWTWVAQKFI